MLNALSIFSGRIFHIFSAPKNEWGFRCQISKALKIFIGFIHPFPETQKTKVKSSEPPSNPFIV